MQDEAVKFLSWYHFKLNACHIVYISSWSNIMAKYLPHFLISNSSQQNPDLSILLWKMLKQCLIGIYICWDRQLLMVPEVLVVLGVQLDQCYLKGIPKGITKYCMQGKWFSFLSWKETNPTSTLGFVCHCDQLGVH